jgi:WD40 repeat protein
VYVWHRGREDAVKVLEGHSGVVNAVTWSATDPSMLVSCGDDGSVRLWTPANLPPPPANIGVDNVLISHAHPPSATVIQAARTQASSSSGNEQQIVLSNWFAARQAAGAGVADYRLHGARMLFNLSQTLQAANPAAPQLPHVQQQQQQTDEESNDETE